MKILAVLCSDIHLSHTAPVARSAESDWYEAMDRQFRELRTLIAVNEDCPLIIAGDIFDRWNSPPRLINFALEGLRWISNTVLAVPGQHDLPNHSYGDVNSSAYGTMVIGGAVEDIPAQGCLGVFNGVAVWGYPWGFPLRAISQETKDCYPSAKIHLAVVHSYIWRAGFGYPGADEEKKVNRYREQLSGWDAAVFGDNHKGFHCVIGDTHVMNCGTFFRRKSDEISYRPMVGLLCEDGVIRPHYLDVSKDVFSEEHLAQIKQKEVQAEDAQAFIEELRSLGQDSLDFQAALRRYLEDKKVDESVRKMVLESVGI